MASPIRILALVAGFLLMAQALAAQTTGRLRGQVTDTGGQALAGATVTVTGDTLIGGARSTVTGDNGTYSFSALPPGLYRVQAELAEFQSQRTENVRVSIGTPTTVTFELPAAFSDQVIVTGEAPIVKLSSSSSDTSYDADFIEDLPLSRSFWDMMAVSPGLSLTFADNSNAILAFGSGVTQNSWQIDGMNSDSPQLGAGWWYINPDTVEEVQVMAIGAPAEFGNTLGAALNVVTKSGGPETKGRVNVYVQDNSWVDPNVTLEDEDFPEFHINKFTDATFTLGGPLLRDKVWYFIAAEYFRDSQVQPGNDPAFAGEAQANRYDAKFDFRLGDRYSMKLKLRNDDWEEGAAATPPLAPESRKLWSGSDPGFAATIGAVLSERTFLEAKASYWEGDFQTTSQTGSMAPATINYDVGMTSGGITYPGFQVVNREQADVTVSHFAEDFLGGDHDFKFGVSYSRGFNEVDSAPGFDAAYYTISYGYHYKYFQNPYFYGARINTISAFVDDSWQVSDQLTLNLGLRFDRNDSKIPSFPRLDVNRNATDEIIPGLDPAIAAEVFSPRLGFAYNPDDKTVIRGSAGVYYDEIISGNWEWPPPGMPPFQIFGQNAAGEFDVLLGEFLSTAEPIDPDVNPTRSLQFSLGFERQLGTAMSYGALLVYKETDDLIGWEILDDGVYLPYPWTNPFSGVEETLLWVVQDPTVRKGNGPGFTVLGPDTEYYQEYQGLVLTFNRRHMNGWSMRASYTLSESRGLIPRHFSNFQNNALFGFPRGADPNEWLGADQLLQGDREHMLRLQANFDLPWQLRLSTSINLQSGRAYSRQTNLRLPYGDPERDPPRLRTRRVTSVSASDDQRYDFVNLIDASIGRSFKIGGTSLGVDLQVFNLLNDDAIDRWTSLIRSPTQEFQPRAWLAPRRLMVRLSLEF